MAIIYIYIYIYIYICDICDICDICYTSARARAARRGNSCRLRPGAGDVARGRPSEIIIVIMIVVIVVVVVIILPIIIVLLTITILTADLEIQRCALVSAQASWLSCVEASEINICV